MRIIRTLQKTLAIITFLTVSLLVIAQINFEYNKQEIPYLYYHYGVLTLYEHYSYKISDTINCYLTHIVEILCCLLLILPLFIIKKEHILKYIYTLLGLVGIILCVSLIDIFIHLKDMSKIILMILIINPLLIMILFLAVVKKENIWKYKYIWLGVISIFVYFHIYTYATRFAPIIESSFKDSPESEWRKYVTSIGINYLKDKKNIQDEDIQKFLDRLPYYPENYKTGLSLEEQRVIIREIDEWFKINKNYLIWDNKNGKFLMDEEAKAARIWTDEYRKTHPWPKDKKPDKPK